MMPGGRQCGRISAYWGTVLFEPIDAVLMAIEPLLVNLGHVQKTGNAFHYVGKSLAVECLYSDHVFDRFSNLVSFSRCICTSSSRFWLKASCRSASLSRRSSIVIAAVHIVRQDRSSFDQVPPGRAHSQPESEICTMAPGLLLCVERTYAQFLNLSGRQGSFTSRCRLHQ